MIHLCVKSPLIGFEEATLFGKGPSLDVEAESHGLCIAINETVLVSPDIYDAVIFRDWTVARKLGSIRRFWQPREKTIFAEQRVYWRGGDCEWLKRYDAYYFDGNRVIGRKKWHMGTGTATAALQLLGEAGVKRVYLNGFDNYWGDDRIAYHDEIVRMGMKPEDYTTRFPLSGTPEEQRDRIRAAMGEVIAWFQMDVIRV